MLTLFSWGYWGWGSTTHELIRAVDATERQRGFKPPIFFDIRANRSVRAAGFRGDTFEQMLPRGRYKWFPRLGNERIATHEAGIKIREPFSAKILLESAMEYAGDKRRVIFFCACEFPRHCHRHVVARLVLEEANRIGRRVQVAEWPGGAAGRKTMKVDDSMLKAVSRGLKSVPFDDTTLLGNDLCLPWGSIVELASPERSVSIVTGPAKFRSRWLLPVYEKCEPGPEERRLHLLSETFRRKNGLQATENCLPTSRRLNAAPKVLTIKQPWAHAIVHLGKDVENRSWRANYKGPLLIHASAHREGDARERLAEYLGRPPTQEDLDRLPTGAIIGVVDLVDYVKDSDSRWARKANGTGYYATPGPSNQCPVLDGSASGHHGQHSCAGCPNG